MHGRGFGLGLPGNAALPAVDGRRHVLAHMAGRQTVDLAPRGALIKPSAATPALMVHSGRAVVFKNIKHFHARIDGPLRPGPGPAQRELPQRGR
jgi:dihydroxyacid dehydratase/phosphogluconate dehydratase